VSWFALPQGRAARVALAAALALPVLVLLGSTWLGDDSSSGERRHDVGDLLRAKARHARDAGAG
jgi:hypothetical protein